MHWDLCTQLKIPVLSAKQMAISRMSILKSICGVSLWIPQKKEHNMSEKVKLLRFPIYPKIYTTEDDQRWTYGYTWEDFEEVRNVPVSAEDENSTYIKILQYFLEHPEKVLKG